VQHRSAATRPNLADRIQPSTTSTKSGKTFSDPAATSYGSEGAGFESIQPRQLGGLVWLSNRLPCSQWKRWSVFHMCMRRSPHHIVTYDGFASTPVSGRRTVRT